MSTATKLSPQEVKNEFSRLAMEYSAAKTQLEEAQKKCEEITKMFFVLQKKCPHANTVDKRPDKESGIPMLFCSDCKSPC